ncbi:MAG: hypothetical protein JWM95_5233 [Gemmatimonadetes bacterium]|nr:hypothetical protein [Gemmatimonadota bacterium]
MVGPEPRAKDLFWRLIESRSAGRRVLAVLMLVPALLAAQQRAIPVQAGVTVERDTVTVGDVVRLVIRVRAPFGATINFPAAVDSLGAVQALEPPTVREGADSATAADRIATYRVAAWDVGTQQIRLGEVLVQTDDGERRIALTLPTLLVKSVLPADTTLRVPKPARPLSEIQAPIPWWWWALAAVAAAVIGIGAWWWARRRRSSGDTGDPYADANAAFARVEKLRLLEAREPGRYAALMTDVLRRYLAQRFTSMPLSHTSHELLVAARSTPTISHDALQQLLADVEPVKFAAAPLSVEDARALGEEAKAIVHAEHQSAEALAARQAQTEARAA